MIAPQQQTIELDAQAPSKPVLGAPCNGCGICCAAAPCPVAILFLFQRKGRCRALLWQVENARYVCGMVVQPDYFSRVIPTFSRQWAGAFFASRISAGTGCDADIEISEPEPE